jgi:hypothetical protein
MAGAVGVFALMTLSYAVVPSEWINFSDKYLQWDTTKFVFRSHQKMLFFPWNWPFDFIKQDIRDLIVVVIYLVLFGLNLRLFVLWQQRGTADAAAPSEKSGTSRFGRPLRRRAAAEPVGASSPTGGA